jgi:hypothetical protein
MRTTAELTTRTDSSAALNVATEPETTAEAAGKFCAQSDRAFDACFDTTRDLSTQADSRFQPSFETSIDGASEA